MKSKRKGFTLSKGILSCVLFLASVVALSPAVSYAAEFRLEDFLILVSDQLILRGFVDVISGGGAPTRKSDLGAGNSAEIGGKGPSRIPTVIPDPTDNVAIISPNVKLGNYAKVSHVIYDAATGSFVDNCTQQCIGPMILENDLGNNSRNDTGSKALPDFPSFKSCTPGATDVIVPLNGNVTLIPGSYRDLIIGANGKVHFTFGLDGVYCFRRIITTAASSYKLFFDQDDIQISVQDFVRLTEYGDFNPTGAKRITLYVAGVDDSYGGANKNQKGVVRGGISAPAAFEYDGDGLFEACFVFVKNGTINLRGYSHPTSWRTQWFGNSLQEISSLKITLFQTDEVCFETKECACISDFKLLGDGTLRVTGFNFNTHSLERLAIFSANFSDILGNVTQGNLGKDQLIANLTILSPSAFVTNADIAALLGPGSYLLGIMSPPTGNPSNYCIFREKLLVIQ